MIGHHVEWRPFWKQDDVDFAGFLSSAAVSGLGGRGGRVLPPRTVTTTLHVSG